MAFTSVNHNTDALLFLKVFCDLLKEMTKRKDTKSTSKTSSKRSKRRVEAKSNTRSTTRGGTSRRSGRRKPRNSSGSGGGVLDKARNLREISLPTFKKPTFNFQFNARRKAIITGLVCILATIFISLSLLSPNQGWVTGRVIDLIWSTFGWGSPAILISLLLGGFWLIQWGMERPPKITSLRYVGSILLFLTLESFASIIALMQDNGLYTFEQIQAAQVGGGFVGNLLAQSFISVIGHVGTIFSLMVIGLIAGVMVSGVQWDELMGLFRFNTAQTRAPRQGALSLRQRRSVDEAAAPTTARATAATPAVAEHTASDVVREWVEPAPPDEAIDKEEVPSPNGRRRSTRRRIAPANNQQDDAPLPQPIILGREEKQKLSWSLPDLQEMLNLGADYETNNDHIREQSHIIEETLRSFGAPSSVVDVQHGPTLVQYCVEPQYIEQRSGKRTKVKVGKIASLADDLALALAARSVRIQAPVPGKGYVGIEVPNEAKALVSLRDVMESDVFKKLTKKSPLTIGLGQDVSGQPMAADLTKMPHVLVAGATGSGKSICVNSIIACLLLQNTPEDLQLVMVDPKRVELTGYNGIPHLAAPVVVDMERVVGTLQWALREMDNRYKLFADTGARNITDYNSKIRQQRKQKLPFIVIIIDELADLMMLAPEDTERAITRLAQMARATGIHMIIATQRPSVDVVTGLIKANFPARIAFAVASSTDSRVVLDTTGAERLLGQGDMLFQDPNKPAPVRMQGCFVSDEELNKLIDYWKHARRFGHIERETNFIKAATEKVRKEELDQAVWDVDDDPDKMIKTAEKRDHLPVKEEPKIESKLAKTPPPPSPKLQQPALWEELRDEIEAAQEEAMEPDHPVDELYEEAVALVRELGKASTSLLQRRFRIGYTRAARLIDAMEDNDIIGPPTGTSKARVVFDEEGNMISEEDDEDFEDEEEEETAVAALDDLTEAMVQIHDDDE